MRILHRAGPLLAPLLLTVLGGCGSSTFKMAPVRGKVTCQGQPVAGGVITFQPVDDPAKTGRPAGQAGVGSTATITADGSFSLTSIDAARGAGALVGPHRVVFQLPPTTKPALRPEERAVMSAEEAKKWDEEFARRPVYPPCPCTPQITPGQVEVKSGDNDFDFTLPPK